MKLGIVSLAVAMAVAGPALAQDIANGEKEFRKCKACHMIQDADGNDVVKGGAVGPNLWNIAGSHIADVEGYTFSDGLASVATANPDMVWDAASIAEYVTDPQAWIDANGGEGKTKMTFKLRKGQEDVAAYLASEAVSPDAGEAAADSEAAAEGDAAEAPASN